MTSDNCRFKSDCDIVSLAPLYHVCICQAVEITNGWCQMFPIRQLNIEKTLIRSLICEQEAEGQDYLHAAVNVGQPNLLSLICAVLQYLTTLREHFFSCSMLSFGFYDYSGNFNF